MNIANMYRQLKQILNDSNEALIEKGLNSVDTLRDISVEIGKLGQINRLSYFLQNKIIELCADDFMAGEIRRYAFGYNDVLQVVEISDDVTYIGDHAFHSCSNLTSVDTGDGVIEIAQSAFNGCANLKNVIIGNSVISIGEQAFQDCTRLEYVIIPDNVTEVGNSVFYGCSNLKSATIGAGVTHMSQWMFFYCDKCTDLYLRATSPPRVYHSYSIPDNLTAIHVPVGSGAAYKSATNWARYADKIVEDVVI